jgi:hypothetical protein
LVPKGREAIYVSNPMTGLRLPWAFMIRPARGLKGREIHRCIKYPAKLHHKNTTM